MRSTWMPFRVTHVRFCASPMDSERSGVAGLGRSPVRRDALCQAGDESFDHSAARGAEEVDSCDLLETSAKARERDVHGRAHLVGERARAGRHRLVDEPSHVGGKRPIVLFPRAQEHATDLLIGEAVDEPRLAEGRFAALLVDLPEHPLEVLARLVRARQEIDRVLERDGAQRLQAAPDLDPQIGRLGRQLVDEQEPRVGCHRDTRVITLASPLQRLYQRDQDGRSVASPLTASLRAR